MAKSRYGDEGGQPDLSFYTQLRYEGPPERILARFTDALRTLVRRLGSDLRSRRRGKFFSGDDRVIRELAAAVDRTVVHIDELESLLIEGEAGPASPARTVLANIVSDANLAGIAEAQAAQPPSAESKFDEKPQGDLLGSMPDIADKANDIAELLSDALGPVGALLRLAAIILRDIGIIGPLVSEAADNEMSKQVESKLDSALGGISALQSSDQAIDGLARLIRDTVDATAREALRIEQKADTLGDLLGKTLVGEEWIVDPLRTRDHPNRTPARSVKDELHDLEALLNLIISRLPPITDGPEPPDEPPPEDSPKPPPDEPVPVLLDWRLKKIYVYAENTFTPHSATERRRVRIRTGAFDLGGWLDLSRLRSGDEVEVQVLVSFAQRQRVLFNRTRFDTPGLRCLADFARGHNTLVGNDITIELRQTASADNFATPIELAYQFVVESQ